MKFLFSLVIYILLFSACNTRVEKENPKEMLSQAYQLFKEGDDAGSVKLAEEVLEIGRESKNDTLIGKALTSLCRNAQRELDTNRLADLSAQLEELASKSDDNQWLMYRAHQNAEMWRLIGDMDKAEAYYDESLKYSEALGINGMFMIDHFNKSFVSTAKGDFKSARALIKKYYQLREEAALQSGGKASPEDAYGLIALAYLLEQEGNYQGAHEAALVCRRLFKEQNIFPEPPDEKPLLAVEKKVKKKLSPREYEQISKESESQGVSTLLDKYLP